MITLGVVTILLWVAIWSLWGTGAEEFAEWLIAPAILGALVELAFWLAVILQYEINHVGW